MSHSVDRYIRFDWAIKRLLRQKANFGVLEGFLTVFLNESMKIVEILESEGFEKIVCNLFNSLKVKATNSKGETLLIIIQCIREVHYFERRLAGVIESTSDCIPLDSELYKVKKIYSITIPYFNIGRGSDYLYRGQNDFVGVHTNDSLSLNALDRNVILPQIPAPLPFEHVLIRINRFDRVAATPIEEWVAFLKNDFIQADTMTLGLTEAHEKFRYHFMPLQERRNYDEYINVIKIQNDVLDTAKLEGRIEGRMQMHKQGLTEGRLQEKQTIARNLKASGLSSDLIAQSTGLSIEEIENL